jgi:hypothetical protein
MKDFNEDFFIKFAFIAVFSIIIIQIGIMIWVSYKAINEVTSNNNNESIDFNRSIDFKSTLGEKND